MVRIGDAARGDTSRLGEATRTGEAARSGVIGTPRVGEVVRFDDMILTGKIVRV